MLEEFTEKAKVVGLLSIHLEIRIFQCVYVPNTHSHNNGNNLSYICNETL